MTSPRVGMIRSAKQGLLYTWCSSIGMKWRVILPSIHSSLMACKRLSGCMRALNAVIIKRTSSCHFNCIWIAKGLNRENFETKILHHFQIPSGEQIFDTFLRKSINMGLRDFLLCYAFKTFLY